MLELKHNDTVIRRGDPEKLVMTVDKVVDKMAFLWWYEKKTYATRKLPVFCLERAE